MSGSRDGQSKSITAIRTALSKIISLNNDFSAVLREHKEVLPSQQIEEIDRVKGNSKRKLKELDDTKSAKKFKQNCTIQQSCIYPGKGGNIDCSSTVLDVSTVTGKVILEQLENEASSLNVDMSVAAKSLVIAQVKLLASLAQDGVNFDRDLEGIISTTRLLVNKKILNTTNIGEHLLNESSFLSLPLKSLWRFSSTGLVSLEQIVKSIHDKRSNEAALLEDLIHLVFEGKYKEPNVSIVSETLSVLISIAYDLDNAECDSLSKYASSILSTLTERMLDYILNKNEKEDKASKKKCNENIDSPQRSKDSTIEKDFEHETVINIYDLTLNSIKLSPEAIESYSSAQLIQVLTHRPNLQLGKVLREQERWRSTQANTVLSSLLQSLLVVLGCNAAIDTLDLVLTNEEVNWGCVLTLVATALNCHRDSVSIIKGMIEQKIRRGCEDQEMESLVIGLLFARHASQEGRHIFPSYSQWFSALFATEASSPVSDKQSFVFLVRFLTDLVPHEPAYCLRAHLTNQMYTPRGCQEILRDYCQLARARLKDLKDMFEPETAIQSLKDKTKVTDEVETAISHYAQTSKVPNFVLEASIFRKPYFRSSFLPVLLAPRPLPDIPDARAKLIETLHTTGKIPSNMYNSYVELCQKECNELLTGVFLDVEEDIVVEEPIAELGSMFEELISLSGNAPNNNSEASAVLPILSRIAQKTEDMMKVYDTRLKDAQHLTVDPKMYNPKLIAFQVIEKFVNVVEKVCLSWGEEKKIKKNQPVWLSQYFSLLSASATLQSTLFTYLLHCLSPDQQQEKLPFNKFHVVGIILSELSNIEGLFLPVVGASTPEQRPLNFIGFFLESLSFTTYQSCYLACSILSCWLEWSTSTGEANSAASLPLFMVQLYEYLAPRIALMEAAKEGKELTLAHVYNFLDGNEVPRCSALYFGKSLCEKTIQLEKWIEFELKATWGNVPLDLRLTYLQLRVLRDFVGPNLEISDNSSSGERHVPLSIDDAIAKILFVLLEVGLREVNASVVLLLLQTLGQQYQNTSICLLKEWHLRYPGSSACNSLLLSFMSICRSLPPSLFLRSDQLLQYSGHLKDIIEHLTVAGQGLQLNLCDTSFLLTVLLNAANDPSVKNVQLQHCLAPLRMAIMFHFESLICIFRHHSKVVRKYCCLEELWTFLKSREVKDSSEITPQEAGIRCLALCIKSGHKIILSKCSTDVRMCNLKWLLAYVGQQQIHGKLPLFPSGNDVFCEVGEKDKAIILTGQVELESLLIAQGTARLAKEVLTVAEQKILPLQVVPTACVLLVIIMLEDQKQRDSEMNIKLISLLIHCQYVLRKYFDTQDDLGRNSNRKLSSEKIEQLGYNDLDFHSELNNKIITFISKTSSEDISKLPKDILLICEPDLKATISYKVKTN